MGDDRKIQFHFGPMMDGERMKVVEKDDGQGGRRRRYLYGLSSGTKIDGTGERMTQKAIDSFHKQAQSGDILLYSGKHGVDFTEDIGKLVDSKITPEGEWMTGYRLYDEGDGFAPDSFTIQKADKLWRQINGLPPYTKPRQKGFSVEGYIPESGGIVEMDSMGRRAMDDVRLEGTLVVSRPAYRDSVAMAVYKALDIAWPYQQRAVLERAVKSRRDDDYFSQRLVLDAEMEEQARAIVLKSNPEREDELRSLIAAYGDLMVGLIMRSESVFKDDSPAWGTVLGRATGGSAARGSHLVALGKLAVIVASRLRA